MRYNHTIRSRQKNPYHTECCGIEIANIFRLLKSRREIKSDTINVEISSYRELGEEKTINFDK